MDSEMPCFLIWSLSSSVWCIMQYTVWPCLVSCHFYAIPIIPFLILQINEKFHKLERGYSDCIKRTRDKTRIYSILHDAPGV